jgi:hypothetical protein
MAASILAKASSTLGTGGRAGGKGSRGLRRGGCGLFRRLGEAGEFREIGVFNTLAPRPRPAVNVGGCQLRLGRAKRNIGAACLFARLFLGGKAQQRLPAPRTIVTFAKKHLRPTPSFIRIAPTQI